MHLVYVMTEKKCPNCDESGTWLEQNAEVNCRCGFFCSREVWDYLGAKMEELDKLKCSYYYLKKRNEQNTIRNVKACNKFKETIHAYKKENEQLKHRAAQAEVSNNILGNTCEELRINVESWMTENQQLKAELDDCLNLELQNEIDQLEAEFANTKENYGQDD